ncbi:MAG: dihydrodipicolinate synthase family protein [Aggregatilineales bacterium]
MNSPNSNMTSASLRGIFPITLTPFDAEGRIDEASLRRVVRFELDGGVQGLGVGGFASEAYKLTDDERWQCASIVAEEIDGRAPLIIGMAAGSTDAAITYAERYATLHPAALMTLPPAIESLPEQAIVEHYVALAAASPVPIMLQSSPQFAGYRHCQWSTDTLAEIAERAPNLKYFKIEGPGSAERTRQLAERIRESRPDVALFGGGGGITLRSELEAGAAGLLPGCGFNEHFVRVWQYWQAGERDKAQAILREVQPLVEAVSGTNHEYSLHARKYLFHRAGLITTPLVCRPTVIVNVADFARLDQLAEQLKLRIAS